MNNPLTAINSSRELFTRQATKIKLNKDMNVIVIGCGGIGSWVGLTLALSGCATNIHLYDNDKLEASNLNRTPYKLTQIGLSKVEALQFLILERRVRRINVTAYNSLFGTKLPYNYDKNWIIIDCRDSIFNDYDSVKHCRIYKVGYDGLEITIDCDPINNHKLVMGETTTRGYSVTPSFICPSQLVANLIVSHICVSRSNYRLFKRKRNIPSSITDIVSFNSADLLYDFKEFLDWKKSKYPDPATEVKTDANFKQIAIGDNKQIEYVRQSTRERDIDCSISNHGHSDF